MAEVFKFFNSAPGDERWHTASDFADYFGSVLSSGVLPLNENFRPGETVNIEYGLSVRASFNSMRTFFSTVGKALILGYSYEYTGGGKSFTHRYDSSLYDRIDRIVLRLDLRNQERSIKAFIKEGEASNNPQPPELTRNATIYELSLAQVRVRGGQPYIDNSDIIDERANEEVCGIVQSLITVPTSVFQQQFDAWFSGYKNENEGAAEAWLLEFKAQAERDADAFAAWLNNKQTATSNAIDAWQAQEQRDYDAWLADLQGRYDGAVAENIEMEVIDARGGANNLRERLDAEFEQVTEQLAQTTDVFKRKSASTPVAGFLFDDSPANDYTVLLPITAQYNVPVSIAVISGYTNQPNYLMHPNHISKLHELEDVHKWDLLAHTDTHPRLAELTYEQQEKEMVDCINKMVSAGFKRPRGIVYPYGSFNSDTITLARKHFEFGTRAGTNKTNSCPIDTYRIQRIQFDFTNPNNAFWWYKQQIDRAYKNGEAIIFMGHTLVVTDGRNWFDEPQQQLMREVIEYIQSIGMPIKTVSDIYDMFKNVYDSPIHEESIGANGKRLDETNYGAMTYTTSADIKATTLISDFVDGVTRKTFLVADGETFIESNGGTLITYKHSLPDLSWQKWHPAGRRTEYKRTPVNNGASWSNWRKVGVSDDVGYTDNNFVLTQNLTSLLNDFPYGRSVRFLTGLTDFKDGTSGTLITHRYENGLLSWQEFHPSGTANVYKRTASADGSVWRKWRTVGDVQLTDNSTNSTPPSSYAIGRTVELLTSNYVLSQSFPVEGGGALLITETSIEPHILTTQRFVDKDGYEYTRLGLNDAWTAWRTNKVGE